MLLKSKMEQFYDILKLCYECIYVTVYLTTYKNHGMIWSRSIWPRMVCTSLLLLLAHLEAIEVIDDRGPKFLNSRCKSAFQRTKMSEHWSILKP